jgi:hypothetical protein
MTKLIAVLIVAAVLFVGWRVFVYWDQVKNEEADARKQAAAFSPQSLTGIPYQLEASLDAAQKRGVAGLRDWLKTYGDRIQDPRKAWIELDYVVLLGRDNVAEAKRVFAGVKARTPRSSPVWPRIEQLAKTYE